MKATLKQFFAAILLTGIMVIGPNSQALLSNDSSTVTSYQGYYCLSGQKIKKINIAHQSDPLFNQTCNVSYQANSEQPQILWHQQRSIHNCKTKAALLALRLEDRGWQCRSIGI